MSRDDMLQELQFAVVPLGRERAEAIVAQWQEMGSALERIAAQQQKTLAMIEQNGFVFDSIGREAGNWQHLAFSIYTDLCKVDSIARAALPVET